MPHTHDAGLCPACLLELASGGGDAELPAGTIVGGRFRIVAPLGRGGRGEVYRAHDEKLGHAVALKFVVAEEETLREVRVGREIAHPNVCRLYDIVDVDDCPAIVMEVVDGEDLQAVLERRPLPHGRAAEVAREICAGLAAIHERGLTHGDLKPANVMIDAGGCARITDFGLAGRAGGAALGGTPAYMAPEQFVTRVATRQSDLYSLGLILRELLGDDHDVVARCLRPDPAARPASAREVLAALEALPSPEYVAAGGAALRLTPRQAWWLAASAAALTALLVALYPRPHALSPSALVARARAAAGVAVPADEAYWFDDALRFHYRASPRPLVALRGRVTDDDPPFDLPGMRRVTLSARGERIAQQSGGGSQLLVYIVLLSLTIMAGAVLAWRNLRSGRVDRAGAVRAALWVFACEAVAGALTAHHPPSLDGEATVLTAIAGAAALLGVEVWVAYAALEPYARREWPQALVSWMRLLQRRGGDPLVVRDVIIGVAAGIVMTLLNLLRGESAYAEAMTSVRAAAGAVAHGLARGVYYALFALFLLVLLRMALRRPAVAAVLWLVATTAAWSRGNDVALVAGQMLVVLLVLQRLGLLAAAIAIAVHLLTVLVPLSVLPQAAMALVLIAAALAFACRAASSSAPPAHTDPSLRSG